MRPAMYKLNQLPLLQPIEIDGARLLRSEIVEAV